MDKISTTLQIMFTSTVTRETNMLFSDYLFLHFFIVAIILKQFWPVN